MYIVLARREGEKHWGPPAGIPIAMLVLPDSGPAMVQLSMIRELGDRVGVTYEDVKLFRLVEQDTFAWKCKDAGETNEQATGEEDGDE